MPMLFLAHAELKNSEEHFYTQRDTHTAYIVKTMVAEPEFPYPSPSKHKPINFTKSREEGQNEEINFQIVNSTDTRVFPFVGVEKTV